jgi:hypothetical protein
MNFKNLDLITKIYVVGLFIFCIFNPLYFIAFFVGFFGMKFEDKFLTGILKTNNGSLPSNQTQLRSIYDPWPTTGVSKSVELENRIKNQHSKWWSTNDEDDLKEIYKLEEELEEYYRQNPEIS